MDPLLILVTSIFLILLASLIVNWYYIRGHYFSHQNYTTIETQMAQNPCVHNKIQTENYLDIQDKEIQNTPQTDTIGMDPHKLATTEQCIQTDRVYYMTLPEQLDCISEQLTINRQDLTCCMEWVGECQQTTLAMANTVDQQTQQLQRYLDSTQHDLQQELQKHRTNVLQDVQFQLSLLAETFEQNRIVHLQHQEAQRPPWEWLPYQHHTRSRQQHWNCCIQQEQFWHRVREREQQNQPSPNELLMPDLEE